MQPLLLFLSHLILMSSINGLLLIYRPQPRSLPVDPSLTVHALLQKKCKVPHMSHGGNNHQEEAATSQDASSAVDEFIGENTSKNTNEFVTPEFPLLSAVVATILFVSFWPLLAYLRQNTFDIDMYLALKGILDDPVSLGADNLEPGIVELPSLSPAERLVDTLFGPP